MREIRFAEWHKVCPICGQLLPLSAFGRNRARSDGRQVHCINCRRSATSRYIDGYGIHENDYQRLREEQQTEYWDELYADQMD